MSRIAVDFDGVIFDKKTGKIIDGCVEKMNEWFSDGHEVTIFTNRPDYDYSTVKGLLDAHDIHYDRIICGKPSYDLFIDDHATKFNNWDEL